MSLYRAFLSQMAGLKSTSNEQRQQHKKQKAFVETYMIGPNYRMLHICIHVCFLYVMFVQPHVT